jgi:hypothetical protein
MLDKGRLHKKATFTLPPEVIELIDKRWRFHRTLGRSLADSKSEYLADLVRRDAVKKTDASRKI